jgi:hypothetical protein
MARQRGAPDGLSVVDAVQRERFTGGSAAMPAVYKILPNRGRRRGELAIVQLLPGAQMVLYGWNGVKWVLFAISLE